MVILKDILTVVPHALLGLTQGLRLRNEELWQQKMREMQMRLAEMELQNMQIRNIWMQMEMERQRKQDERKEIFMNLFKDLIRKVPERVTSFQSPQTQGTGPSWQLGVPSSVVEFFWKKTPRSLISSPSLSIPGSPLSSSPSQQPSPGSSLASSPSPLISPPSLVIPGSQPLSSPSQPPAPASSPSVGSMGMTSSPTLPTPPPSSIKDHPVIRQVVSTMEELEEGLQQLPPPPDEESVAVLQQFQGEINNWLWKNTMGAIKEYLGIRTFEELKNDPDKIIALKTALGEVASLLPPHRAIALWQQAGTVVDDIARYVHNQMQNDQERMRMASNLLTGYLNTMVDGISEMEKSFREAISLANNIESTLGNRQAKLDEVKDRLFRLQQNLERFVGLGVSPEKLKLLMQQFQEFYDKLDSLTDQEKNRLRQAVQALKGQVLLPWARNLAEKVRQASTLRDKTADLIWKFVSGQITRDQFIQQANTLVPPLLSLVALKDVVEAGRLPVAVQEALETAMSTNKGNINWIQLMRILADKMLKVYRTVSQDLQEQAAKAAAQTRTVSRAQGPGRLPPPLPPATLFNAPFNLSQQLIKDLKAYGYEVNEKADAGKKMAWFDETENLILTTYEAYRKGFITQDQWIKQVTAIIRQQIRKGEQAKVLRSIQDKRQGGKTSQRQPATPQNTIAALEDLVKAQQQQLPSAPQAPYATPLPQKSQPSQKSLTAKQKTKPSAPFTFKDPDQPWGRRQ